MFKDEGTFMVIFFAITPFVLIAVLSFIFPICKQLFPEHGELIARILSGLVAVIVIILVLRLMKDKSKKEGNK